MLSLNSYLPLEVVKSNKALQGIECKCVYAILLNLDYQAPESINICRKNDFNIYYKIDIKSSLYEESYPAPTLADIIDSDLLTDENKHKVLDQCIADWHIDSISKFITENICKEEKR